MQTCPTLRLRRVKTSRGHRRYFSPPSASIATFVSGAGGEAFVGVVFLYRFLAGMFFATLFRIRGFGIAVGAHSGYDVLVGLILR